MDRTTSTLKIDAASLKRERQYDFIYDPIYKFSSNNDYNRVLYRAKIEKQKIYPAPIFSNMFSELPHFPNVEYLAENSPNIPNIKIYTNYNENFDKAAFEEISLAGKDRAKYFRRPIIPAYTTTPVMYDSSYLAVSKDINKIDKISKNKKTLRDQLRNAFTQTDYRENETQTYPYTPDFVFKDQETPEILNLMHLKHGCGLPAGLIEIEAIERAREKREMENMLPPITTKRTHKKRMKIMEEIEEQDYEYRNIEIEKFHKRKLAAIVENLKKQNFKIEDQNKDQINKHWLKKQKEQRQMNTKLNIQFLRDLRKLHGLSTSQQEKQKIISNYSNSGSTVFAPLTRLGVFPDAIYGLEPRVDKYYNSLKGLTEIEEKVLKSEKQVKKLSPENKYTAMGFIKRKFKEKQELDDIYHSIKEIHKQVKKECDFRMLIKIEKEPERPATPVAKVIEEVEEYNEEYSIILTKTIRGKFYQNQFLREKHAHLELLEEIKSTYGISSESILQKNEMLKQKFELQRNREADNVAESKLNKVIKNIEGSILGETADYLSKELVRLQDERRIEEFVHFAEDERLKREAEEAGRRQIEIRRKIEEEDIFKQISFVHQNTVSHYLEDMCEDNIEKLSERLSVEYIQDLSKKTDEQAYSSESKLDEQSTQDIIAELVHEFLFPEVKKECERSNKQNNGNKYLNSSASVFFDMTKE